MVAKKKQQSPTRHLITDFPKVVRCIRCGETVLAGYFTGMRTWYDLSPLSPIGELEALKLGRRTFYMIVSAQYFGPRTPGIIRKELRPRMDGVVIREHVCGTPRSIYTERPRNARQELPDECPY